MNKKLVQTVEMKSLEAAYNTEKYGYTHFVVPVEGASATDKKSINQLDSELLKIAHKIPAELERDEIIDWFWSCTNWGYGLIEYYQNEAESSIIPISEFVTLFKDRLAEALQYEGPELQQLKIELESDPAVIEYRKSFEQ